ACPRRASRPPRAGCARPPWPERRQRPAPGLPRRVRARASSPPQGGKVLCHGAEDKPRGRDGAVTAEMDAVRLAREHLPAVDLQGVAVAALVEAEVDVHVPE